MMAAARPGIEGGAMFTHFQRHGAGDPALQNQLEARRHYYPSLVPAIPEAYIRLQDNQVLSIGGHAWRIITGFGHSPEHVALHCASLDVLISGDMVLPRISTNVSVVAIEPESNPVQQYVDSLDRYTRLAAATLVLPAHGKPFRGLHTRVTQLREHHAARLEEVLTACSEARTAAEILPVMFHRPLDGHQLSFALGEALAHLHQLWFAGRVRRLQDASGVYRFQRTESPANDL